jgi:hypothetical protein
MSVYTVHEPPLRAAGASADPERFVFVRDGFYLWAFLLTPFWLLWHRLWLAFASYVVLSAVVDSALRLAGASAGLITLVGLLISLLVGLEAGTLQRLTLRRRRWRNIGLVSGDDLEDAERRFFDSWLQRAPAPSGPPFAAPSPVPSAPPTSVTAHVSEASRVIGLFPEPGVHRWASPLSITAPAICIRP